MQRKQWRCVAGTMAWLILFALLAGVLNALQAGANAGLHKALDQPAAAGLVITAVGGTVILLAGFALGLSPRSAFARAGQVPWWAWFGGAGGATYVLATLLVAEKVGAALFTALVVTAAIVTSLALDHFGWLGFEQHGLNWGRAAGGLLMIAGLVLLAKF